MQSPYAIDWLAIASCVVAGQLILTIWFVALFGRPWAKAYGGPEMTPKQHTKEVPGYTYGIGAACVLLLSLGLGFLQTALGVSRIFEALFLAGILSATIFIPMAMPAYAFLRRWGAWWISAGSQLAVIAVVSVILVLWR